MSSPSDVFVARQKASRGVRFAIGAGSILPFLLTMSILVAGSDDSDSGFLSVDNAIVIIAFGGIQWLMWTVQLRIRIDHKLFYARVWPFRFGPFDMSIPLDAIMRVETRTVDPWAYGGYGPKGKKNDILYSLGGVRAVTIYYATEGSETEFMFSVTIADPEELHAAVKSRLCA